MSSTVGVGAANRRTHPSFAILSVATLTYPVTVAATQPRHRRPNNPPSLA